MKTIRIQRKRTKGWTMPENTVYVGRPSRWGNPFNVSEAFSHEIVVLRFEEMILGGERPGAIELIKEKLKGKNLACWCPLDQPCHADILLEVANR